jgi:hypothetical protein
MTTRQGAILVALGAAAILAACDRLPSQDAPFSRIPIPDIESQYLGNLYWVNDEEIFIPTERKGLGLVLNVEGHVRDAEGSVEAYWYSGCNGGGSVYQINPYSMVEQDAMLRKLQESSCAVAKFPPSHDQATYWASFSLLSQHGYVTLPSAVGSALLHKPDGSAVPLTALNRVRLVGVQNNLRYYAFKGAYLLHNTRPKEIEWLYSHATLEVVQIVGVLDRPGNSNIYSTRVGFIQQYSQSEPWTFVLLNDGKFFDIEKRRLVRAVAVSPNGCRVAYAFLTTNNRDKLALIDVCHK